MGTLDGKVAFITGAGRGQGRSHALRLADEGADVVALDTCADGVETVPYGLSSRADLDQTVALVEAKGRRIIAAEADVRDLGQVQKVLDAGLGEFGRIDVVCANAGVGSWSLSWEMSEQLWKDMIDVNLTGVFNTPLVINDATFELFAPDVVDPGPSDVREAFAGLNILPDVPWIEPSDVSEAVAWLCSDAARYITGIALPIDAGNIVKKG